MRQGDVVMNRPNIFNYAKKELSQDAMLAWLLACIHSESQEYRNIGIKFAKYLMDINFEEQVDIEIDTETPLVQHYSIDVYAIIVVDNKACPIIIEDKTNTFLHSDQLKKYCEKVASWMSNNYLDSVRQRLNNNNIVWGDIYYVYFKSGFVSKYEDNELIKQFEFAKTHVNNCELRLKKIYLDDMVEFLNGINLKDNLFNDYLTHLLHYKELFDVSYKNALSPSSQDEYTKYYSNSAGLYRLFENTFGECSNINDHVYQGWASYDIFSLSSKINPNEKNNIQYLFRFEKCASSRKKYAYAFQLQQYRYERGTVGNDRESLLAEKFEQANLVQKICVNTIDKMNSSVIVKFQELSYNKSYDGKMIFKVFIEDSNSPKLVSDFINKFTMLLIEEIKNLK